MTVNRERAKLFILLVIFLKFCQFFFHFAVISGKMGIRLWGLKTRDCGDHETNLHNGVNILPSVPETLTLPFNHQFTGYL